MYKIKTLGPTVLMALTATTHYDFDYGHWVVTKLHLHTQLYAKLSVPPLKI